MRKAKINIALMKFELTTECPVYGMLYSAIGNWLIPVQQHDLQFPQDYLKKYN